VIFSTGDIGKAKAECAGAAIARLNPHVAVETHGVRLTANNALDLIARYDLIADGSDNFATRYLVSDACYFAKKPLVTAAVGTFDGSLTTIRAHENSADGRRNPTYRCLFPEPPPAGTVPACAEAGILGALPGVLGSLMALEVIRELVGFWEGLVGRLLMVDARSMRFMISGSCNPFSRPVSTTISKPPTPPNSRSMNSIDDRIGSSCGNHLSPFWEKRTFATPVPNNATTAAAPSSTRHGCRAETSPRRATQPLSFARNASPPSRGCAVSGKMAIIAGSGLFILYRESVRRRERKGA